MEPRTLKFCSKLLFATAALSVLQLGAFAQGNFCTRYPVGSTFAEPRALYSTDGKLTVDLSYHTQIDSSGNPLYCFVTKDGTQSPTLHVHPGDELIINFTNVVPYGASPSRHMRTMPAMSMTVGPPTECGPKPMNETSVNMHFHGTNVAPVCHQDEVIQTVINSGEGFRYDLRFPADEPPGLYWYHPHIHGMAEGAVLGGASGAIVVDGIENANPIVAGLPQRTFVLRDNVVPGNPTPGGPVPAWDISLNYIPIPYPSFTPVVLPMKAQGREFWRVVNAAADTIYDLQLRYDGVPQPFTVVGLDGVPVGSQDGTGRGKSYTAWHFLMPPGARAEFVVTGPSTKVKTALLYTANIDTGPFGDNDPERPIALIKASSQGPVKSAMMTMPAHTGILPLERFSGLDRAVPTTSRKLYFSEVLSNPSDPSSPTNFFITVDGATPLLFDPANPPAIVTTQGAVEDWTIENRSEENHEFHIHQIHFLQLEENGRLVSNGQYLDTIQVPYWTGTGPYPSVKVRMDFRGPTVGDFVYHCHILGHEDNGMMAIIRVKPAH